MIKDFTAIHPVYMLHQQTSQKLEILRSYSFQVFKTWTMFNFMGIQFHGHVDAFAGFGDDELLNL